MPRIAMTTSHQLGREEAYRRLKEKIGAVRDKHGSKASHLREEWTEEGLSFSFEVKGIAVEGAMAIEDREVRLSAEVPFRIVILKRMIESRIRAELGPLLS